MPAPKAVRVLMFGPGETAVLPLPAQARATAAGFLQKLEKPLASAFLTGTCVKCYQLPRSVTNFPYLLLVLGSAARFLVSAACPLTTLH